MLNLVSCLIVSYVSFVAQSVYSVDRCRPDGCCYFVLSDDHEAEREATATTQQGTTKETTTATTARRRRTTTRTTREDRYKFAMPGRKEWCRTSGGGRRWCFYDFSSGRIVEVTPPIPE